MKKPVNNYFNKSVDKTRMAKKFDLHRKTTFGDRSKIDSVSINKTKIIRKKMFIKNDLLNKSRIIEKKQIARTQMKTGWGNVASWYESTINSKSSAQRDIILPALLSFMPLSHMEARKVLDLGCGTGFFMSEYVKGNPEKLYGVDIDNSLLEIAYDNLDKQGVLSKVNLNNENAENLKSFQNESLDVIFSVEALVNILDLQKVSLEISRTLKKGGKFVAVVNHPAFRVPQSADWYYDAVTKRQGRVVYKYKTAHSIKIDMNPGSQVNKEYTYTFHRSIEDYINTFMKVGMITRKVREVYSNKKSEKTASKKREEDKAREEIPMFMIFEFIKN